MRKHYPYRDIANSPVVTAVCRFEAVVQSVEAHVDFCCIALLLSSK